MQGSAFPPMPCPRRPGSAPRSSRRQCGLGRAPERRRIKSQALQRVNGGAERLRPWARGRAAPVSPGTTDSGPPPSREDDGRPAAGHGLERHDAEVLDRPASAPPGSRGRARAAPRRPTCPRNSTSAGAAAARRAVLRAAADDLQRAARAAIGLEDEVEALVGREGRDHEVVRPGRVGAGREEVRVHGRRGSPRRRGRSSGGCARPRRRCWRRSGGRAAAVRDVPGAQPSRERRT